MRLYQVKRLLALGGVLLVTLFFAKDAILGFVSTASLSLQRQKSDIQGKLQPNRFLDKLKAKTEATEVAFSNKSDVDVDYHDDGDVIDAKGNKQQERKTTTAALLVMHDKNTGKKRFLAYDQGSFGGGKSGIAKCSGDLDIEVESTVNAGLSNIDIAFDHMSPPDRNRFKPAPGHRLYTMVFGMESEPHSPRGDNWDEADFRMWYNLDLSFPAPATYFDNHYFLPSLLAAPTVPFEQKNQEAPIVWVVSNCHAFNGREKYMAALMKLVDVHSYGACLKNRHTHTSTHMEGNVELFAKYKFVIAIENSNCYDYVTEKLVHAIASGSVPIVASRDNKPGYLRFVPKGSYVNIYDFKKPADLATHIKKVAADKTLYESYMKFRKNNLKLDKSMPLEKLVAAAKTVFDADELFLREIVDKEKSENKLCKIAKYLAQTPPEQVESQIKAKKVKRPSVEEACLPTSNLEKDLLR